MSVVDLTSTPLHLGLGATAVVEPPMTGVDWYEAYGLRHAADGAEGRLVTVYAWSEPWSAWEMHPVGEEVVICLSGRLVLHQEVDGGVRTVELGPLQAAINPRGVWHTADAPEPVTALFLTAGEGTTHRPR